MSLGTALKRSWQVVLACVLVCVGVAVAVGFVRAPNYKAQSQLFVKTSVDGWHGLHHARWLVVLTLLAAFALVVLQASRPAPALPISAAVAVTILGALTVLWLIFRVLVSAPGDQKLGAYIGLISACVIVYGGYESMRKEGIASRDEPKEIPTVTLEQEPGS